MTKYNKYDRKTLENTLRVRRELECFPIVNRGKLWYDLLTNDQLEELRTWYNKWLDATRTLIAPIKPIWLDKTLGTEDIL